jgi:cyclopropane-fatty-acyl-phospholipid synthase
MTQQKSHSLDLPIPSRADIADTSQSTATDRFFTRAILKSLNNAPLALVLWDGHEVTTATEPVRARVHFRDRGALYRLIRNPELHFGDLYSVGRIEIEGSLVEMLEIAYRGDRQSHGAIKKLRNELLNRARRNTLNGSRHNIHHHYDLGNDFYQLWLDREVTQYTCAYFPTPTLTLEQAQLAKLDHVCRKLQLKPGDTVVEAGCGWGGLARHMARHYGATVRAFNISREQVAFATAKAKEQGLSDRVEFVLDDYRNIRGDYDVFVSVGMLEHVGPDDYRTLGEVARRVLREDGRGLIHSIGRNSPEKMNAWIEKRIFPGAYPPSLREMMDIFEPNGLSVLDVENLRLHYAKTLEHWLARYEQHAATVEKMFDREFVRAWRLYLAGSLAGFSAGTLQLFQVVFANAENNNLAWSRAHLYRGGRAGELHAQAELALPGHHATKPASETA